MITLLMLLGAGAIIYHLTRQKAANRNFSPSTWGKRMTLQTISGVVSHLRAVAHTHGRTGGAHGGNVTTSHFTLFRVDGHPVTMDGVVNVDNGDEVTVAGLSGSDSSMKALALRDNHSGLMFAARANVGKLVGGIIATFAGVSCGPRLAVESFRYGGLGNLAMIFCLVGAGGIYLIVDFIRDSNRIREAQSRLAVGVSSSSEAGLDHGAA